VWNTSEGGSGGLDSGPGVERFPPPPGPPNCPPDPQIWPPRHPRTRPPGPPGRGGISNNPPLPVHFFGVIFTLFLEEKIPDSLLPVEAPSPARPPAPGPPNWPPGPPPGPAPRPGPTQPPESPSRPIPRPGSGVRTRDRGVIGMSQRVSDRHITTQDLPRRKFLAH
jgi:hypothetical protein